MNFYLQHRVVLTAFAFVSLIGGAHSAERWKVPTNALGEAVLDASGKQINYSREKLAHLERASETRAGRVITPDPAGFVPTASSVSPFWQYAIFGSGIGASNIVVSPAAGGGAPEIIVGGNAGSNFGGDNFWQVLRRNSATNNYDTLFVSQLYSAPVERIGLANVRGDSGLEIVVMLSDGRIYLYDARSKVELGYIATGVSNLEGLCLADLNGDNVADLVVTTAADLFVFNGSGTLLWQLAGAGGYDVVVGQMDNDPALEIATTKGTVIDATTHALQWTRTAGFGSKLKLAPITGSSYQQLIAAEGWNFVYSYDVANQLPRWSIHTPQDIGAIQVADVDNDGTPEVIIGDGQWGSIHVHDLNTQAQKWAIANPEHGVTNIAVADADNDGVLDLLWGAGWSSTGADYLYVAGAGLSHKINWQSVDLGGPFLGPLVGDLDGDGKPELVVCSYDSESSYDSGRILVFDLATLALRGISAPIVGNLSWTGVQDLKLRDLDGDGRMEIVVAADRLYDGVIEIYSFDTSNKFTLKWTNTTRPSGSPFKFVDVADLNGDGVPEIITGNTVEHTGSEGVYVYIYNYPATDNPWRSVAFAGGFASLNGLVVEDLDGNGQKDFAALVSNGDLYTFDGPTRVLKSLVQQTSGTMLSRRLPSGLIVGTASGFASFLQYSGNSYTQSFNRQLGTGTLAGINVLGNGELWAGHGGTLSLRLPPSYDTVAWQSPVFGSGFGRFVATAFHDGVASVFSADAHAVAGFACPATQPPSTGPSKLGNISTRSRVETGDDVLIGGFIVTGSQPKKVLLRAIGPSLAGSGVANALSNPTLELHDSLGAIIASNDDWRTNQEAEISATTVPPRNDLESAIVTTLPANNASYTAIVRGNGGGTGVALVEVYDLEAGLGSSLGNISTRGLIESNDNPLIAGTIVTGDLTRKVLIRALGPSMPVENKLRIRSWSCETAMGPW